METTRPPRDNLFRAVYPGVEMRAAGSGDGDDGPTMFGHFAVTNQWTRINSIFEGDFLERFAPGAFRKTIKDRRDSIRVLFQHGRDPQIGNKPLGPIRDLREDDEGAYYEVDLLDADYVREIKAGLEENLYGASFRFRVIREEVNEKPKRSAHNPGQLTERTIKEAEVIEFGPVTFPAYEVASAGVRSVTDEFLRAELMSDPDKLRELFDAGFVSMRHTGDEDKSDGGPDGDAADDTNDLEPGRAEGDAEPEGSGDAAETDAAGDRGDGEKDAPPVGDAEPEAHLARGRRAQTGRLYGDDAAPTWRL